MKRLTISKNAVLNYSKDSKESKDFNIIVKKGVESVLVLNNNPANIKVKVESKANFTVINYVHNIKQMDTKVLVELIGNGASAKVYYAFHGQANNKHFFDITMHHRARNTKGDILIRGVYEGKSLGNFYGMIKIDKKGQGTDSYFTDNVLLLDQGMGVSVPNLEIEANDVKASHGSTTGKIDEDQLFYLTSRGVSKPQAKRMIIDGFFEPIFDKLPMQKDVINKLEKFFFDNIPSTRIKDHYLKHIKFVRYYGQILAREYEADQFIIDTAALLHDTGADQGIIHAQASAKMAKKILKKFNFEERQLSRILSAISNHSSKKPGRPYKVKVELEDRILRDADALSFFDDTYKGYYQKKKKEMDPESAIKKTLDKMIKMKQKITTPLGIKLANDKYKKAVNFFKKYEKNKQPKKRFPNF